MMAKVIPAPSMKTAPRTEAFVEEEEIWLIIVLSVTSFLRVTGKALEARARPKRHGRRLEASDRKVDPLFGRLRCDSKTWSAAPVPPAHIALQPALSSRSLSSGL
jgi:hypothetical protein